MSSRSSKWKACELSSLDDAVLVNIFGRLDPLPDLFSLARVCKRFREVASCGRLWLHVSGPGGKRNDIIGHRKISHHTLKEAVEASRPGDTIMMSPTSPHVANNIAVQWPLRIVGAGRSAEETSIYSERGAATSILFLASGMVSNLCVWSDQSPCVTHSRGKVKIDGCILHSKPASGLEHLYSPLVTTANCFPKHKKENNDDKSPTDFVESDGILTVIETKIRGKLGTRAVSTRGSGSISGVRVISLSSDALYWFEVDSSASSSSTSSQLQEKLDKKTNDNLPLWAKRNQPLFPESLQGSKPNGNSDSLDANKKQHSDQDLNMRSKTWGQKAFAAHLSSRDHSLGEFQR